MLAALSTASSDLRHHPRIVTGNGCSIDLHTPVKTCKDFKVSQSCSRLHQSHNWMGQGCLKSLTVICTSWGAGDSAAQLQQYPENCNSWWKCGNVQVTHQASVRTTWKNISRRCQDSCELHMPHQEAACSKQHHSESEGCLRPRDTQPRVICMLQSLFSIYLISCCRGRRRLEQQKSPLDLSSCRGTRWPEPE